MSVFADAIDTLFAEDAFAVSATYTPPGGGVPVPCRVIRKSGDRELGGMQSRPLIQGDLLEVRASEVTPAKSGSFMIGAGALTVLDDPRREDPELLVWTVTVR